MVRNFMAMGDSKSNVRRDNIDIILTGIHVIKGYGVWPPPGTKTGADDEMLRHEAYKLFSDKFGKGVVVAYRSNGVCLRIQPTVSVEDIIG
jgi:hypothetical protein